MPLLSPRIAQGRLVIGVDGAMYGQHYLRAVQRRRNDTMLRGVQHADILGNIARAYELFCAPRYIDGNLKLVQGY